MASDVTTAEAATEATFAEKVAALVLARLPSPAVTKPASNVTVILKYLGAGGLCLMGFIAMLHKDITGMEFCGIVLAPALSALGIHSALTSAVPPPPPAA